MDRLQILLEYYEEDPNDTFTLYALGLEYLKVDPAIALDYFKKAIAVDPDYVGSYYQLGILYASLNERTEAENTFRQGIEIAHKVNNLHALAELKNALNNMLLGIDDF